MFSRLKYFGEYLWALLTDWKALVSGIGSILSGWWVTYHPPTSDKTKALLWLIFGICFLLLATGVCFAVILGQLRREKIQKLHKQGKLVIATVTNVQQEREERGPADFPIINYCYYIEAQ